MFPASSVPKHRASIPGGAAVSASANVPLSPRDQEILSLCLHSPEDLRDIGMLLALLSAEHRKEPPP